MSLPNVCSRRLITSLDRTFCRYYSQRKLTNAEIRKKRNAIFEEEKARQLSLVTRIEKIEVNHVGPPDGCTLVMNKGLSTPYHCAMHLQDLFTERSVLALVNDEIWDMHQPLEDNCTLEYLHFLDTKPFACNDAFWRSMAFVLGHVLETAFKDSVHVELCSFPPTTVKSGSFLYDANLDTVTDSPVTAAMLRTLSQIGYKLSGDNLPFEPLYMDASVAEKMFDDNQYKLKQISKIAAESESGSKVKVYRMGEHIDINNGPLISSTAHISWYRVTGIFPVDTEHGPLHRVQGLAIPRDLKIHYWGFEQLAKRAAKLNTTKLFQNTTKSLFSENEEVDLETGDIFVPPAHQNPAEKVKEV